MKYKVGDKVRIKSIDWYNENKDEDGYINCGEYYFVPCMSVFCGKMLIIDTSFKDGTYQMEEDEDDFLFTDEMIEGLVKEENKKNDTTWMYDDKLVAERYSDKIAIKEPKYNKLSINTEFCDDKVELVISPDFELKQEGDKWFAVKKKKEYPKTYAACWFILKYHINNNIVKGYKSELLENFQELLICRDAYWKIAGEEMGLGKPWEPTMETVYCISRNDNVIKCSYRGGKSNILEFPTPEMRDAFYENFKELIEICKELL